MKSANFKDDLVFGHAQEKVFADEFQFHLIHLNGRGSDFKRIDVDEYIELKNCRLGHKTQNLFMEYLSDEETGTPGGPWQSQKKKQKAEWYFYRLIESKEVYKFNTDELVKFLNEQIVDKFEPKRVKNLGYWTQGFAVPISSLQHLFHEFNEHDELVKVTSNLKDSANISG